MIKFNNKHKSEPYALFYDYYLQALEKNQPNADAICISSYSKKLNLVDSRFVNLKFVNGEEFIFFSNYRSPKSSQFNSHDQISVSIFWHNINVQVRFKASIKETSKEFNQLYFQNRSSDKNALAISSSQSKHISSFKDVKDKYYETLNHANLSHCPNYWGGYAFIPYEIEYWFGNKFRLNKRILYKKDNTVWNHFILEP